MKIMLDSHQPPFSERYKVLLTKAGISVEDFHVPPLRYDAFVAYCKQIIKSKSQIMHFLWAFNQSPVLLAPRLLGKKVVLHWIGSDVTMALNRRIVPWKVLGSCHLAMDISLSQELQLLKIKAGVVRAPCDFPEIVPPWPTEYKVLTYLPPNRGFLYGPEEVLQLAKDLPWATFLVTANDGKEMPILPNVRYLGWLNREQMNDAYAQCKVVLRLTKHDAGASTVVEGLARERYAIWTKRYPSCLYTDSYGTAKYELEWCLKRKEPNRMGREVVLADFDQEKITQQLIRVYEEL